MKYPVTYFFHLPLVSHSTPIVFYVTKCFKVHILEASDSSFAEDYLFCMCHLGVSKMYSFI